MSATVVTKRAQFFRWAEEIDWRTSRLWAQKALRRPDVQWALGIAFALLVVLAPRLLWAQAAGGATNDGGAVGASIRAKFESWTGVGVVVAWGVAGFGILRAAIKFFQGDPEARSIAWSWVFGALCVYLVFDILLAARGN